MHVIKVRNVNCALKDGLEWLKVSGLRKESRNGAVIRSPEPVTTVYVHPTERVLWLGLRDANPFFHYLESLWMLAGRNDVKFPATYAKQIGAYSDDGVTLNGAYGYRWRKHFGYDQIMPIVEELKKNPDSRRCVLQMWDATMTEGHTGDLWAATNGSSDVPCNTSIYFDLLEGKLNMTVSNRSNDSIWGAYGANSVHMSILQEYVASHIGVGVGRYYQISNNFHVYTGRIDVDRLFDGYNVFVPEPLDTDLYLTQGIRPFRLVNDPTEFDKELYEFFELWDNNEFSEDAACEKHLKNGKFIEEAFFDVAIPMVYAHRKYKEGDLNGAKYIVEKYMNSNADWHLACIQWLERRGVAKAARAVR